MHYSCLFNILILTSPMVGERIRAYMPITLALERWRQEDREFKATLSQKQIIINSIGASSIRASLFKCHCLT